MRSDPVTRGWIELAVISRSVWVDPKDLQARLAVWRVDFPNHPGLERLAEIGTPAQAGARKQMRTVGLLLPLSGSYAASAEAVRDGFFAAWYAARGGASAPPAVRLYDTGGSP